MNVKLDQINKTKNNFIFLHIIPLLLVAFIYISYGNVFDNILIQQSGNFKLYQLNVQLSIFQNAHSLGGLPKTTSSIGYYSINSIYYLFTIWLLLFSISSYIQLSISAGSKMMILFETIIIFIIYMYIVSPGLDLWIFTLGYLLIAFVFIILVLYWLYDIKVKQ